MARRPIFENLVTDGVRGLQPYVPGKPMDELEREYGIRHSIKLASNENPIGPPACVVDAMRSAAADAALYPDGGGYRLKQVLADKYAVAPSQITLGNGSNELLVLLAETFMSPGVQAIYDQHSFVVYRLAVQAVGATARVAASYPHNAVQPFGHDLAAFSALMTANTRLVFIANPNNPTGTWTASSDLREFIESVPADVIVVVDEAYGDYVTDPDYPNAIGWLNEFPNLVVTRTFSKIYGLAGLRIGYAISHSEVAELLNRVRQPFNVNHLAQVAAIAALQDESHVVSSREMNQAGLRQLTEGLNALGFPALPSIGNFVLADMRRPAQPYYEALLRAGIIVRPVANYGLPEHLRITVGLPEHNDRLLSALSAIKQQTEAN
jgi:histidinol-phosphate aminotransferase